MTPSEKRKRTAAVIHKFVEGTTTLQALDVLATAARNKGVWLECEEVIHSRNMRLLGRDGTYAMYEKDGVQFKVWDGWTISPEKSKRFRVHARALSENGFHYIEK